ncbi:MAG: glutamate-1-semialdehyde 2,1-aminomutase [Candidatus Methanomethylophilaceae archaeon]|nr:glutamate-1-semialdehyde 2,1-aminomutase [Candidatus Methanomethylophilaceae archaeon]
MRGPRSAALFSRSKALTPGGVSSPVRAFPPNPLFIAEGKGSHIIDADGNEYVDLCMAYGPLIAGHACPDVIDAAAAQIRKGTVYGAPSEPELSLIEKIAGRMPSCDMVRLACSGTEATMHAIRLARGHTGKDGIVKIDGGFHGAHDAMLIAAGSGSAQGVPGSAGVPEDAVKNTYAVDYNDAGMFESLLDKNDDIAAVIMEPVLGNVGVVPPKKGYLEEMRKITSSHGVLLIFDEVITGMRLSGGGAQKMLGVTPDLTTMGKIIGGGFPAGAFGGKREIMENVAPQGSVYAAGTFAGNPVSAAAGLALLNFMEGKYGALNAATADLVSSLRDSLADSGVKGCIQSVGSMFSIGLGMDSISNGREARGVDRESFAKLFACMLDSGVYLPPSALEVEFMSAAHTEEDSRKIAEAFDSAVRRLKA